MYNRLKYSLASNPDEFNKKWDWLTNGQALLLIKRGLCVKCFERKLPDHKCTGSKQALPQTLKDAAADLVRSVRAEKKQKSG